MRSEAGRPTPRLSPSDQPRSSDPAPTGRSHPGGQGCQPHDALGGATLVRMAASGVPARHVCAAIPGGVGARSACSSRTSSGSSIVLMLPHRGPRAAAPPEAEGHVPEPPSRRWPDAVRRSASVLMRSSDAWTVASHLTGDPVSPPTAQHPEVRTKLTGVLEPSPTHFGVEREPFDHMRNRAAHHPKVDRVGTIEPDRLHRRGDVPRSTRRSMSSEHHVATSFEDLDLAGQRPRCPPQVRRGDHIEHRLARRSHRHGDRPQRPQRPPDTRVQRQLSADDEPVAQSAYGGRGQHRETEGTRIRSTLALQRW